MRAQRIPGLLNDTVFIAAGIAGENWLRVALKSMPLGVGLYVIPLGMIANPSLIRL